MGSFGGSPGYPSANNQGILHIRYSDQVNLSAFWQTEIMGVQAKVCSCETDSLSHVEREEYEVIAKACYKQGNQWVMPYP